MVKENMTHYISLLASYEQKETRIYNQLYKLYQKKPLFGFYDHQVGSRSPSAP
jgi:hypothetical protein